MIASNVNNAPKHKSFILRRTAVQPKPANTLAIQSITPFGADKATFLVTAVVEGDMQAGSNVRIAGTSSGYDGIWKVISVNYTANTFVLSIPNAHMPNFGILGVGGTAVAFGAFTFDTISGTSIKNDDGENIGEGYANAGTFVFKTGEVSTAVQLCVLTGSMSGTFQVSLDGVYWATISPVFTTVTTSSVVFINDMPDGVYIRINITGTGTYYLIARG